MTNQTTLSPEARAGIIDYLQFEDITRRFLTVETLEAHRLTVLLPNYHPPLDDTIGEEYTNALEAIVTYPIELIIPGKKRLEHLGGYLLSAIELSAVYEADRTQQYPTKEGEQ